MGFIMIVGMMIKRQKGRISVGLLNFHGNNDILSDGVYLHHRDDDIPTESENVGRTSP